MQKPTEKPLKVYCTLWRQWVGLAAMESISPKKGYLLQYTKVLYIYQVERTSQCSDQLHCFYNRFFSRLSSATLSFPPRSTTGISFYDSILSKFSHLNLWKHQYMPTVSLGTTLHFWSACLTHWTTLRKVLAMSLFYTQDNCRHSCIGSWLYLW